MEDEQEAGMVIVGQKPSMAYVLEAINHFNSGKGEVRITAKGKAISRAVDVAETVRRRFMPGLQLGGVAIGTEDMPGGTKASVSTIEITLRK